MNYGEPKRSRTVAMLLGIRILSDARFSARDRQETEGAGRDGPAAPLKFQNTTRLYRKPMPLSS